MLFHNGNFATPLEMTTKLHNIFFTVLLLGCIVLTLRLDPPIRNYIPIVWGLMGFGLHWVLFIKTWLGLSRILIDENKTELAGLNIGYHDNGFKKTVDIVALLQDRKKIEAISTDIKIRLSYYRTFFRLAIIAFPMFAVLAIITVVMTWN